MEINQLINKDNLLIIAPIEYKNKILAFLSENKIIHNIKFMALNEYQKNYYFDYDYKAIKYLMEKYNLSVLNAKEIINNLMYVENKNYNNEKLDKLVLYKEELDENNLLKYNPLFKEYVINKNVVVVGYGNVLNNIKEIIKGKSVEIIYDEIQDKKYSINEFDEIEKEVEYLYDSISDLLNDGVDINSISIINSNSEYETYFKRFNTYYSFKIDYNDQESIFGKEAVKTFILMLETNTREEIYNYLIQDENDINNKLINILNKYSDLDINKYKDLLIEDIKKINIKKEYTNIVKCRSINDVFNENEHVFLIGFNDKTLNSKKDIGYINNSIRKLVNMPLVEEENELLRENLIRSLSNIKNLYISYAKASPFSINNKQIIFDDNKVEYINPKLNNNYSDKLNKTKYAYLLDRLNKYSENNIDLNDMYNKYGENDYLKYDNRFNSLSKEQTNDLNNVVLSYSSMNEYNECEFKYYLNHVLGLNNQDNNFDARLGTLVHNVLKDYYVEKKFDFEKTWTDNITKNNIEFVDEREKYFVNKIKEEIKFDIDILNEQKNESVFDKVKCEQKYSVKIDNVKFEGFIDKILYKETDNGYLVVIVDYKTGSSITINKSYWPIGLSLQLPSYLFLLNKTNEFGSNVKYGGFYIQHLISNDKKYKEDKNIYDIKRESMKLEGFSSSDLERLKAIDTSLLTNNKANNVKGLAVTKAGELNKTSLKKCLNDYEMEQLVKLVEDNIKKAGLNISKGEFNINPKVINDDNIACKYCTYNNICYKRNIDLNNIEIDKEDNE